MMSEFYTNPTLASDDLTPERKLMVQNSWAKALEHGDEHVGSSIFRNLFEINPDLLKLFNFSKYENYEEQKEYTDHIKKVTGVLTKAVEHLDSMDELVTILSQIGAIHVPKGV